MKNSGIKICLFLIFSLFLAVDFAIMQCVGTTFANENDEKLLYIESASVVKDGENCNLKDFTSSNLNTYSIFVGDVIDLTIVANNDLQDLNIIGENGVELFGGSTFEIVGSADDFTTYSKKLKCNLSGSFNIIVISYHDGEPYFDSLHLFVYDSVSSVTASTTDNYVTANQLLEFDLTYNDNEDLIYFGDISATLTYGENTINFTTNNFASYEQVSDFDASKLVINTAKIDASQFTIKLFAQEMSSEQKVIIQDLALPSEVILSKSSVTYNLADESVDYYLYMSKNSKPIILIKDESGSISLNSYAKVETDLKDYDKIKLNLKLNSAITFTNVLFIIDGLDGKIYKSIGVSVLDVIKSVKIQNAKEVYANKEDVALQVVVNGYRNYSSPVKWFVNDNQMNDDDNVLNLIKNGGKFTVYAMIGDVKSDSVTFVVRYSVLRQYVWYILLALSIIGIIILALTKKKRGQIKLYGSLTDNLDELSASVRELKANFKKKTARKIYRDMLIVKERCWQTYNDNEEHLYKIAFDNLKIANSIMKNLVFNKYEENKRDNALDKILSVLVIANDALLEYKKICAVNE